MLRFEPEPRSFIRAALIHVYDGAAIGPRSEFPDLLEEWGSTAEDPDVIRRCQEITAREKWGSELENPHVLGLLFYNLRHACPDWALLTMGVQELLDRGPKYLLFGAGPAAHKLLKRRDQVMKEIHRLSGFTRLAPAPDGTMVGRAPARHQTGDLIALTLARRNPGQPLALLTPGNCWFAWQGRVTPLGNRYQDLPDDGFAEVWLTYYRSQFIGARNNPRHAARAIPQEYWQWLDEGRELMEAKARKSHTNLGENL